MLGPALVASALVADAQGQTAMAMRHVEEFEHVTRNRPYFRAQNLTDAVRIACTAGELELAERLPAIVITSADRDRLANDTAQATIADARGGNATPLFQAAAEGWQALGCVLEQALALRGAGDDASAVAILAELGVRLPPAQTAARTAK